VKREIEALEAKPPIDPTVPILRVIGLEAVLFAGYLVLPIGERAWLVSLVVGALAIVIGVGLATRRGRALIHSDRPVIDAAIALSLFLTLLLVGFSSIYYAMATHGHDFSGLVTRLDALYFTVTTVATVGFGDVVPVSQWGRFVVTIQMVFDLTFVAVSFRLLGAVAQERHESSRTI